MATIRTIKDRDTHRHHFIICLQKEEIVISNRKFKGSATKRLALNKAQAICALYGVEI